jgi:hypothetical protein
MAFSTIVLEPSKTACLCEQHFVDRVSFANCEVMITQKQTKVVNMVSALQLVTGNAQRSTGKLGGMAMAFKTTIIPHSV